MTDEEKAKIAKREYFRKYERIYKERRRLQRIKYWAKRYDETHGTEETDD